MAAVEDDLRDGDKYFEDGDLKRAAAAYDRAIAKAPGQVAAEAYGKRAAIYIIQKDFDGGLAFVQKAKARYPNAPELLEQEALMLWQKGRKDDAVAVAERVVKTRPQAFLNQQLIGEFYYPRDPVKVASAFEAYLQHRPAEAEGADVLPRIRLGFAYLANARSVLGDGDEDRAKQFFGKAKDQFEIVNRKHGKKPNAQVNADNGLCAAYVGLRSWDQAISVCERVKQVDPSGSVHFNLTTAYLARKQLGKARDEGNKFLRIRKNEARGFMLLGDTFFEEGNWNGALDQYLRAEKALRPNQTREQGQLAIRLGKTYLRLPPPAGATTNPNLNLAIDKLATAFQANPNNVEIAVELGGAYIKAKQDNKASALTERILSGPEFAKVVPEQRASVLVISAKSLFNQEKLTEARQRFEAARQIKPTDVQIQKNLIFTINAQAAKEIEGKDYKQADAFLGDALRVDPGSATTLTNVAVLSLEQGNCDAAERQLTKLAGVRARDAILTQRLLARSLVCKNKPDLKKAAQVFQEAEQEAKKANSQLLAEIYAEWAPLIWTQDPDEAVVKLETAMGIASQDPTIAPAVKRNLAIARYLRGWQSMRAGKVGDAAGDFEKATNDPSVLKGTEPAAFEFSYALSLLDSRPQEAAKIFRSLNAKGNASAYLKGAYAQVGTEFFTAYASYKASTGAARETACQQLSKNQNQLGQQAREIVAACWEGVAYDHHRAGNWSQAEAAMKKADATAPADMKRRFVVNRAAMNLGKGAQGSLAGLGENPPEALVNLGIIYDSMNKPREAYEAWTRAKAKGVNSANLQKWIDAKKRIYGY